MDGVIEENIDAWAMGYDVLKGAGVQSGIFLAELAILGFRYYFFDLDYDLLKKKA